MVCVGACEFVYVCRYYNFATYRHICELALAIHYMTSLEEGTTHSVAQSLKWKVSNKHQHVTHGTSPGTGILTGQPVYMNDVQIFGESLRKTKAVAVYWNHSLRIISISHKSAMTGSKIFHR